MWMTDSWQSSVERLNQAVDKRCLSTDRPQTRECICRDMSAEHRQVPEGSVEQVVWTVAVLVSWLLWTAGARLQHCWPFHAHTLTPDCRHQTYQITAHCNCTSISDCFCKYYNWLPIQCNGKTLDLITKLGPVSARVGDRLWMGKPLRCRSRHPGLLSLSPPSVALGRLEWVPGESWQSKQTHRVIHQPISVVSQCGAGGWLKGLASGDQRRPTDCSSALEMHYTNLWSLYFTII